jgi:hypothetical protein
MYYVINVNSANNPPKRRDDFIPNKRFVNDLPNYNRSMQWDFNKIKSERQCLVQMLKLRGTRVNRHGLNFLGLNMPYKYDYHQTNPGELDRLFSDPDSHIIIPSDLKDTFRYLDLYQGTKLGDKKRENHGKTYYGKSIRGGYGVVFHTSTQSSY